MAQEVSTRTTTASIAPAVDFRIAQELAVWQSGMVEGGALTQELPAVVRSRFGHRLAMLKQACAAGERTELEEAVAGLMMRYPSMRGVSPIEAQVMTRAYADDLAGMPVWAVQAAIADIAKGAVSDVSPDFAPSAPRLRQLAQEHLGRPTKEMRDLKRVLSAPVEMPDDPNMRERVKAGLAELQKRMPRAERGYSIYRPAAQEPAKQAMSVDQLMEHYANHNLGFEKKQPTDPDSETDGA